MRRARRGHKVLTQSTLGLDRKSRPSELLSGMHRAWVSVLAWPPRAARDRAVTSDGARRKMHRARARAPKIRRYYPVFCVFCLVWEVRVSVFPCFEPREASVFS